MRPYLAIIKDSFRAAMASRVLYVLLLLITVLLLVFAPLHIRETLDWELRQNVSVRAPARLLRRLVDRHETEKPVGRIWELLPKSMRKKMVEIVERPDGGGNTPEVLGLTASALDEITYQLLVGELNRIIKNPDFYRADDWEGILLTTEADDMIASGVATLTKIQSRRLNRLLIAKAVSPEVESGNATAISFYYAVWETPFGPLGMTRQQFAQGLTTWLPWFFDKFVMSIGLLVAVLVTANMIPETFQSGSLNLLLSKPVSRWGLYVAKFGGGCVFVALCASYLFVGTWVWLGLGMGVWDRAILLSIPLYLIVFAIYFSVSAFVGLIWRSAIVSVIVTLMFWGFCFVIGSGYGFLNMKMVNSQMIGLLPVGDQVMATDSLHQLSAWQPSSNEWSPKVEADLGEQGPIVEFNSFMKPYHTEAATAGLGNYLVPAYDRLGSQVIASRFEIGQSLASGRKSILVADADDLDFVKIGVFPRDTIELFGTERGVIAASAAGLFYRMNQEEVEAAKQHSKSRSKTETSKDDDDGDGEATKPNLDGPGGETDQGENAERVLFDPIGPESPVSFRSADLVDYSHSRDEFASYRMGVVSLFRSAGDQYEFYGSLKLNLGFNKSMSCRLAYQGDQIVLAFGNGKVITVDGNQLVELNEYQLESRSGTRWVAGSPSGRYFGVLYRNGNLWMMDREGDQQFARVAVTGQGNINSFAFTENDRWWVTDDSDRVTEYELDGGSQVVRHVPAGSWAAQVYRLGFRPFYRVCPKPSEFYKVVPYLSSSGDSESNENVDLNFTKESSDPWSPLTSGLGFMLVMLGLGCVVFHFKDY